MSTAASPLCRGVATAGEERVLLRLVEPVDLVDEEDGGAGGPRTFQGPGSFELRERLPDLLDARQDRRIGKEDGIRLRGEDPGKGRLPRSGRTPEDEGGEGGGGEHRGEELPLPQQILLPDEVGEGGRTHPVGQRRAHAFHGSPRFDNILHYGGVRGRRRGAGRRGRLFLFPVPCIR